MRFPGLIFVLLVCAAQFARADEVHPAAPKKDAAKKETVDLEALGKRLKAAVAEGKMTPEHARSVVFPGSCERYAAHVAAWRAEGFAGTRIRRAS